MAAAVGKGQQSAIRVNPNFVWPSEGDDGKGEVEEEKFSKALEEIFPLSNEGQEMAP